jgi:hypothetical protein
MRLSIVIMAHPARAAAAKRLATDHDAAIVWDEGGVENLTGDRAWAATSSTADWSIVLQDDALPIPNFRLHAGEALAHAVHGCVSFYTGTTRPRAARVQKAIATADELGAAWLEANTLLWGVAVALPTELVNPMLSWVAFSKLPYDERIGAYCRHNGIPITYTHPSLVDHDQGRSLTGHHVDGRRAHRVGMAEHWDTGTVRI